MEKICFEACSEKRYYLLLIYDVPNDKRRTKLSKLMEGYGRRVQMSAFECKLNSKQHKSMLHNLERMADKDDNIRIYYLSERSLFNAHSEDYDIGELYIF